MLLPFYVVLETVQEALATGWAGGAVQAQLDVKGMVPALTARERNNAAEWFDKACRDNTTGDSSNGSGEASDCDFHRNDTDEQLSPVSDLSSSDSSDDCNEYPGFTQLEDERDDDSVPPSL